MSLTKKFHFYDHCKVKFYVHDLRINLAIETYCALASFLFSTDLGYSRGRFTRDQKTIRENPESRTSTEVSSRFISPCSRRSFRRKTARRPKFGSCRRHTERDDDWSLHCSWSQPSLAEKILEEVDERQGVAPCPPRHLPVWVHLVCVSILHIKYAERDSVICKRRIISERKLSLWLLWSQRRRLIV